MARVLVATLLVLHMILLSCSAYPTNPYGLSDQGDQGGLVNPQEPVDGQEPDAYNQEREEKKKSKKHKKQKKKKKKNDDDVVPEVPAVTSRDDPTDPLPEVPGVTPPHDPADPLPEVPGVTPPHDPTDPLPEVPQVTPPHDPTDPLPEVPQVTPPELLANINLNGLQVGFYNQSCPRAEEIVAAAVAEMFRTNPNAPANILRLQFHDCFVGGCDASVLLDSTASGEDVEKSSAINFVLLKGTDLIDDIKLKLEEECPQTVSCADTLAFAAREALALTGLPRLPQPAGRRDALVSLSANVEALKNLPAPDWTMDELIQLFKRKGFTEEEMVILTGAHSIGGAHCAVFTARLNNYKNSRQPDPDLNPAFLNQLRGICLDPKEANRNPMIDFDETPTKLDNLYFKNMMEKKALLSTDQSLFTDPRTSQFVQAMANNPDEFIKRLAPLMLRMGAMDVLTGTVGEVRKTCRSTL